MFNTTGAPKETRPSRGFWPPFDTTLGILLTRAPMRGRVKGLVMLLLSGALSGVAFIYLASQRWRALDAETVLFTVTYTQWATLGVTLAKLGLDTYLFALVTGDPRIRLDLNSFLMRYSAPISFAVGLALIPLFGLVPALLLSVTVLSDSASALFTSQMTALRQYSFPAVASLLKYPAFFVLLLVLSFVMTLHALPVAAALCVGSILRFVYLATRRLPPGERNLTYKPSFWIAVHHPLNLILFKADQLMLPLVGASALSIQFQQYAYLTKWPELVAGLTSSVGIVFLPVLYRKFTELSWPLLRHNWIKVVLVVYAAGAYATTLTYCLGFKGAPPIGLALPFSVSVALLPLVNLGTYALLRQSHLRGLIRNLTLSLLCGLLVCGIAGYTGSAFVLSFAVPIQLTVFLILLLGLPSGTPTYSYAVVETSNDQAV